MRLLSIFQRGLYIDDRISSLSASSDACEMTASKADASTPSGATLRRYATGQNGETDVPCAMLVIRSTFMGALSEKWKLDDRIRGEFLAASAGLKQASAEDEANAHSRLHRAVRRLYDFVGYGKLPSESEVLQSIADKSSAYEP